MVRGVEEVPEEAWLRLPDTAYKMTVPGEPVDLLHPWISSPAYSKFTSEIEDSRSAAMTKIKTKSKRLLGLVEIII